MEHVDLNDLIKVPVILSTKQCRIPRWEKETDPGPFFLPLFLVPSLVVHLLCSEIPKHSSLNSSEPDTGCGSGFWFSSPGNLKEH